MSSIVLPFVTGAGLAYTVAGEGARAAHDGALRHLRGGLRELRVGIGVDSRDFRLAHFLRGLRGFGKDGGEHLERGLRVHTPLRCAKRAKGARKEKPNDLKIRA